MIRDDEERRVQAIEIALQLISHYDDGISAEALVTKAAIIEKYLRN